jgi:xanthine/CO dehydrogenase XdhC/CoxF family maturation factor/GTP:adenosylcobinamide-phosphate guanylyltransferase
MNSSLTGIVKTFQNLLDAEKDFVLATIIETTGSTYRKAGARLLITRSGKYFGLLGGGCFEADLLEHALKIFESKQNTTLHYDMRGPEDLVWGLGLGCNGAVKIRLEYLSADNQYEPVSLIQQALELERKCIVATICESSHPEFRQEQHFLIDPESSSRSSQAIPETIYTCALKTLETGDTDLQSFNLDGHEIEVFISAVIPPVHLLIIGGGPDSVPVINTAKQLGWTVSVVDYRDGYTRPENFPKADNVIKAMPEHLSDTIDFAKVDALVLMTHKFEYDLRYLKNFVNSQISYIGLLGPTARKNELLKSLDDSPPNFMEKVYGPVGIDIGGELPEEIALSLIAEIQAVMHGRDGAHLSDKIQSNSSDTQRNKLSIIILAAGGSSRFGGLKQLLEYKGKSLLKRAVETALDLGDNEIIVVHGPKAMKCQREISSFDVINIINQNWGEGLSTSLIAGIDRVSDESDGALVLLCDQPLVDDIRLGEIVDLWNKNPDKLIASEYAGTKGVPIIIPRSFFDEVRKLKGDVGAKKLLADAEDNILSTPVPEAELDIDTEQDFAGLLRNKVP